MKSIITSDKANKPYGFAQLDNTGKIPETVAVAGTASFATAAGTANSATTATSASYAATASIAATAVYAENGTQWTDTNTGIKYDGGSEVILGSGANPGILTTAYNTNGYYGGYVDNAGDFDTLIAASPIITQSVYPNIDNISRLSEYYALKFEGYITVPTTDTYTFGLESDDASDAFIDDTVVAAWYGGHGGNGGVPGGNQYPISLAAGRHPLLVRFQEVSGGDFVTLYYKTGSMSWTIVPDEWFSYGGGNTDLIVTGSLNMNGDINAGFVTLTGSEDYILSIHGETGEPWAFGLYNDYYNPTQSVFAGWVSNNGRAYIGNEIDTAINIYTNADYDHPILQISSSGVNITGSLKVNGNTIDSPYKVYTALLTQAGGDDGQQVTYNGLPPGKPAPINIHKGITYTISTNSGGDFLSLGAPNNDVGTSFVANQDAAYYPRGNTWTLDYNNGAPVVTSVLENTLGNVWFTYDGVGAYIVNSDNLFTVDKTACFIGAESTFNYSQLTIVAAAAAPGDSTQVYLSNQRYTTNLGDGTINQTGFDGIPTPISIEIRVYN